MSKQHQEMLAKARGIYEAAIAELPECPKEIDSRSGCKVSWYTYATREEAEIALQHAKVQAEYYSWLGYDFGYLSPGSSIEGNAETGFTVTFP